MIIPICINILLGFLSSSKDYFRLPPSNRYTLRSGLWLPFNIPLFFSAQASNVPLALMRNLLSFFLSHGKRYLLNIFLSRAKPYLLNLFIYCLFNISLYLWSIFKDKPLPFILTYALILYYFSDICIFINAFYNLWLSKSFFSIYPVLFIISILTLIYINFVYPNFNRKYPGLYWLLTVFATLIFIICVYKFFNTLLDCYNILKTEPWRGSGGDIPSQSGSSNTGFGGNPNPGGGGPSGGGPSQPFSAARGFITARQREKKREANKKQWERMDETEWEIRRAKVNLLNSVATREKEELGKFWSGDTSSGLTGDEAVLKKDLKINLEELQWLAAVKRLRSGLYANRDEDNEQLKELKEKGYPSFFDEDSGNNTEQGLKELEEYLESERIALKDKIPK